MDEAATEAFSRPSYTLNETVPFPSPPLRADLDQTVKTDSLGKLSWRKYNQRWYFSTRIPRQLTLYLDLYRYARGGKKRGNEGLLKVLKMPIIFHGCSQLSNKGEMVQEMGEVEPWFK